MGYQIILSPSARRDLRDIVRYISLDSPTRAADFPEMGRVVPEFDDPSIREIVVRSYRIIHRIDPGDCRVEIARFWHGARGTPDIGTA